MIDYPVHHRAQIAQDVPGGNSQHCETEREEPFVPRIIARRSVTAVVHFPINLDRQSMGETGEIEHEAVDRILPPEAKSTGPLAQFLPEQDFRKRHRLAHPPRLMDILNRRTNRTMANPSALGPSTSLHFPHRLVEAAPGCIGEWRLHPPPIPERIKNESKIGALAATPARS